MSKVAPIRVMCQILLLFFIAFADAAFAQQLLRLGQEPVTAEFHEVAASGELVFNAEGAAIRVPLDQLVRWSTAPPVPNKSTATLSDGSRVVLAESWTGTPSLRMSGSEAQITTHALGKVSVDREQLRRIDYGRPQEASPPVRGSDADLVNLANGDVLRGEVLAIAKKEAASGVLLQLSSADEPTVLPLEEVRAINFGTSQSAERQARLLVGLREGSLLRVDSLQGQGKRVELTFIDGSQTVELEVADIVFLQSLSESMVYLSDLEPLGYRHVPYLDIPWPLARDRSCLGKPLTVGNKRYPKGLGMHTASRVTYEVPKRNQADGQYRRFVALLALDEHAGRRGSVVFRVYLEQNGEWRLAHTSPILRGGEAPVPLSLPLGDAERIALIADYADRGDERDYANWLDARLEP